MSFNPHFERAAAAILHPDTRRVVVAACDRIEALEAVAEVVRVDLNKIATMPWCKDSHTDTRWTCVPDAVWTEWIHGTHEAIYEALATLDEKKVQP